MADDWKSYVDLDGTHVHVAANSPTTVAELLEQRGVHRAQIVQACGGEPHLLAELIGEAWQLADFAARHQLVPLLVELQGRIDAALTALDGGAEFGLTKPGALHAVRAALQDQRGVPGG